MYSLAATLLSQFTGETDNLFFRLIGDFFEFLVWVGKLIWHCFKYILIPALLVIGFLVLVGGFVVGTVMFIRGRKCGDDEMKEEGWELFKGFGCIMLIMGVMVLIDLLMKWSASFL